jgi:ATP-dependent exoDNAse (exonuclease V) beta subunit
VTAHAVDAEARRRIAGDLDTTLFVEAAAGTGKTTALVRRILAVIETGRTTLDRIVAVTFTEKAAGEMKLRLRAEIERARNEPGLGDPERERLRRALSHLEVARIATIHAFCADLLRERTVEAEVDPLFEVAPAEESARILDAAFDAWFESVLSNPPEGVARMLRRRPSSYGDAGPREKLRRAATALVEHRDFDGAWRRRPFDRRRAIDAVMDEIAEVAPLADLASDREDWLARNLRNIARFHDETTLVEAVRAGGRDHDALEGQLSALLRRQGGAKAGWTWLGRRDLEFGADLTREEVLSRRDRLKASLERLAADCDADLAACLHVELQPVVAEYERRKRALGKLDFLDLLVRARDLVRRDRDVRADLQGRFDRFFVDEFQDTDPLQAEIVLLLSADSPDETDFRRARPLPGKLFVVGDPKQSIYRFRRADVALYEEIKRHLVGRGAEVVHLTTSFRATPSIQAAVNAAFAPRMGGAEDGSQAEYVPLAGHRTDPVGQPSLVALPVPRPYSSFGRVTKFAIEDSLPDAVGAFVDWLVHRSGWTVTERGESDRRVSIAARHVCILFRRFRSFGDDVARPYVRALEARRLPHVLIGGHSFHEREEVLAVRNALAAIEWPDDRLRVYATLRGPFFALGDDAILSFAHRAGSLHPLLRVDREPLDDAEREVASALDVLGTLHLARNRRPIADTLTRLLGAVRAHAGIAIWPTGEQALANCLRLVDRARRYERRGAPSFRSFVEWLEREAEEGEGEEAPVVEEGTEGVRIMTVHKAKGLEFPVVVLADPTCRATREPPTQFLDAGRRLWAEPLCGATPAEVIDNAAVESARERAEAVRVAYVAATRARDLLVLPVVGDASGEDEATEGWFDVLRPIAYPAPADRRRAEAAPGCPPFGQDSVYTRDPGAPARIASVAPGLHLARAGTEIVWWDPAALELDREEEVGLRQDALLSADESGAVAEEGTRAHAEWQSERAGRVARASRPTLAVRTVTAAAEAAAATPTAPGEAPEAVERRELARRAGRPRGVRFGALVHATLAVVPLDAGPDAVHAVATAQGRLVGATDVEIAACAEVVSAALADPWLVRAAASDARGGLRRETPVFLGVEDGGLLEGTVDLAFREAPPGEPPSWTVVDFKTDVEIKGRGAQYETQVRLYARAVARATGEPARGVLLVV